MPAAQPRRSQEDRSNETRHKLAQAAFELIQEAGYANFRVAAVARAAGVSQGGQLHHFPTKDAMTMAAINYAIELARTRAEHNLAAYAPGDDAVDALVADCRDYYFSASFDVAMDVTKAASDNTPLRREIAHAHRAFRDFAESSWQEVLEAQGWSVMDARDLIAMSGSLVRGFAIRAMIRPDRAELERLMGRWRQMVALGFPAASPLPD